MNETEDEEVRGILQQWRETKKKHGGNGKWHAAESSILLKAADVTPVNIDWILEGYIGEGVTTLIQGPIGARKTTLLMAWASALTTGSGYHKEVNHRKRGVLYISIEGGSDYHHLRNQFRGDPDWLWFSGWIKTSADGTTYYRPMNLWEDRDLFMEEASQVIDLGAIIIEPIATHMGSKVDTERVHKCHSVIEEATKRFGCGCIASSHLNKDPFKAVDMRASGAIEIVTRSPHYFNLTKDPDDNQISNLVAVRTRYYREDKLGFSFRHHDDGGVEWLAARESDAGEALRIREKSEGRIRKWIKEQVESGDKQTWQVRQAAEGAGYEWGSVQRIAGRMEGVEKYSEPMPKGKPKYWWKWVGQSTGVLPSA